jgi:hypothetical protein
LPYIGENFAKEYIIPNYIGESLAALLPSILSLSQGLGKDPGCHNVTNGNVTKLDPMPINPNYSVQVYFILIFILLGISTLAFSCLHFSPLAIRERKQNSKAINLETQEGKFERLTINNQVSSTKNQRNETIIFSCMTFVIAFLVSINFLSNYFDRILN